MKTENKKNNDIIIFKKVWLVDKYNFYEYIAVMIDGWVWVTEALSTVKDKITSAYFKQKIEELIIYISSWDSFSKSMKKVAWIFDDSEVSIIEAWETTWQLSESLMKLSEDLKKIHNLKSKIKWALTYPFIIFVFLIIAVLVVLTYVIPALKPLFDEAEVSLPFATQALLSTSNFVRNNFFLIILLFLTWALFILMYLNTIKGRIALEKFFLQIPLIWKVYRNYLLANITATLWNLVGSGVSILKSLSLTWKASKSAIYEILFEEVSEKVQSWEKIVSSMWEVDKEWFYFPSDYLQMLSVWEKTANLEGISKKLSSQYEKEVDYSLASLTKWIEPLAILFAWIFVTWFAFAIFWAMLKITETVS